jgi:hypothetical protein
MAHAIASTHLNAYMMELQEAEQALLQAQSRVSTLKRQIDAKRVEEGLEPLYDVSGKKKKAPKEPVPPEATGFGISPSKDGK